MVRLGCLSAPRWFPVKGRWIWSLPAPVEGAGAYMVLSRTFLAIQIVLKLTHITYVIILCKTCETCSIFLPRLFSFTLSNDCKTFVRCQFYEFSWVELGNHNCNFYKLVYQSDYLSKTATSNDNATRVRIRLVKHIQYLYFARNSGPDPAASALGLA